MAVLEPPAGALAPGPISFFSFASRIGETHLRPRREPSHPPSPAADHERSWRTPSRTAPPTRALAPSATPRLPAAAGPRRRRTSARGSTLPSSPSADRASLRRARSSTAGPQSQQRARPHSQHGEQQQVVSVARCATAACTRPVEFAGPSTRAGLSVETAAPAQDLAGRARPLEFAGPSAVRIRGQEARPALRRGGLRFVLGAVHVDSGRRRGADASTRWKRGADASGEGRRRRCGRVAWEARRGGAEVSGGAPEGGKTGGDANANLRLASLALEKRPTPTFFHGQAKVVRLALGSQSSPIYPTKQLYLHFRGPNQKLTT
ncbi:unnamed protein product [Miscanthus lutarioriparius]|uniref:Uncharacterized protein n=1 Tax=Miscanthus lutarioriparius TaxID=422564 RepID=A0A811S9C0_9POAL|nr:unnamed protein product [Miscanthus lutarioriparius]